MSGGSYNYLCHAWDLEELSQKRTELQQMTDRLTQLGAVDAAKETAAVLLQIRQAEVWVTAMAQRLEGVWKAVEWVDSSDWGPDRIDEALAEYRKGAGS